MQTVERINVLKESCWDDLQARCLLSVLLFQKDEEVWVAYVAECKQNELL